MEPLSPPSVPPTDSDRERELQEREIAARERELSAREREIKSSPWLNPLVIGVFVAAFALIGNIFVAVSNNRNSQSVERMRAQASLVFDAIKTNSNQVEACKNLVFLVHLGLLDDPHKAIQQSCETNPSSAPSLPASGISAPISGISGFTPITGFVQDADTKVAISGATVTVSWLGIIGTTPTPVATSTDKNGFFSVQPSASSSVSNWMTPQLTIEKDGYIPLTTTGPVLAYEMHKIK